MRENVSSKTLTSLLLMGLLLAGLIAASGLIEQVGSQSAFKYAGQWTGTVTGKYMFCAPAERCATFHYEMDLVFKVGDSGNFTGMAKFRPKKLDYVFKHEWVESTSSSLSKKELKSGVHGVISLDPPKIKIYFDDKMIVHFVITEVDRPTGKVASEAHDWSFSWTREFTYEDKGEYLSLSLSFSKKEGVETKTEQAKGDIKRVGKVEEKEIIKEAPFQTYEEKIKSLIDVGDKQEALDTAMEYLEKLGLDFSVMTLPPVYVDLKTRSGVTWWEKYNGFYSTDTAIYEPAFANPSILISTVMHEWVHPTQVEECKTTTMSSNALEVEAYLTELERSEETGLAKWTTQNRKHWDQIKLQLKKHYDLLKPEEKEIFEDRYKKVMETLPGVASTITLYINPTSTTLGEQITINGSLYPPQEAPVAIEYSMDGGSTWTAFATVTSAPDGSYSYTWKATSAGTYLVRASWPGDAHRMGATEVKTLTVEGGQAKASISNVQFMSLAGGTLTASSPYAETPLEMRIEAVKEEYPLDGPINILVTIRNIGSATVTLNQRMAVNREEAPEEFRELAFHVVKPSGEKAKFKAFINIDFPSEEDFIKLEENSAIERMVDITTHHYYYTKLYDMYEPDVYTLKATYSNQESGYYEWNGTAWVKVELGAWRGKLESNTIEIKIVEEEKQTNWLIWAALGSAFAIGGAFLFLGRRGPSKPTSPTQVPGEEAKALNVVRGFLDQMRVRYSLDPAQNTLISRGWGVEGKVFTIVVGISGPWVVVRAIILAKDRIPTEAEPDIYKRMLEVSYSYPELRYDVDGEGNLGTTQTMPIAGLNLENFKSEFTAVLDAIKHFVTDIAPKFEIEL